MGSRLRLVAFGAVAVALVGGAVGLPGDRAAAAPMVHDCTLVDPPSAYACPVAVTITGAGHVVSQQPTYDTGKPLDCTSSCTHTFITINGDPLTISLTATADAGWSFAGWTIPPC